MKWVPRLVRVGLFKCAALWGIYLFYIYDSLEKLADSADAPFLDQFTYMQTDTMAPTTWSSKILSSTKDNFYNEVFVKLKLN